jgi:hypothetical protein
MAYEVALQSKQKQEAQTTTLVPQEMTKLAVALAGDLLPRCSSQWLYYRTEWPRQMYVE